MAGTHLKQAGHDVRLFDKGRGAGGLMASRRIATALGDAVFDHDAPYFTVRDAAFATFDPAGSAMVSSRSGLQQVLPPSSAPRQ